VIQKIFIENFKSIRRLEINCRRINLFIGEPNTGKSNILELLGLLSWFDTQNVTLREYVRFQGLRDIFYGGRTSGEPIRVKIADKTSSEIYMEVKIADGAFHFQFDKFTGENRHTLANISLSPSGKIINQEGNLSALSFIKSYTFQEQETFPDDFSSFLMPPHGSNLFAVIRDNRELQDAISGIFGDFGLRLILKPEDKTFSFQKRVADGNADESFSHDYSLTPDTLQRIVFYITSIESNENSTLVFEEPESHAFPYYAKYLGEKIAFDEKNQYFIATHNPYLLLSILEKSPKDEVNVFIAHFKDYSTQIKRLSDDEVSELMDYDPFFNLDSFIKDEEGDH
jgi:hypothetical protein